MHRRKIKAFALNKQIVLADFSFGIFLFHEVIMVGSIVTNDTEKELMMTGNHMCTESASITPPDSC